MFTHMYQKHKKLALRYPAQTAMQTFAMAILMKQQLNIYLNIVTIRATWFIFSDHHVFTSYVPKKIHH